MQKDFFFLVGVLLIDAPSHPMLPLTHGTELSGQIHERKYPVNDKPFESPISFNESLNSAIMPLLSEAYDKGFAAGMQHYSKLIEILKDFLNGVETNAITSDHDETFANLISKTRAALAKGSSHE